ncbi:Arginase [Balamuthia mandrillaris]
MTEQMVGVVAVMGGWPFAPLHGDTLRKLLRGTGAAGAVALCGGALYLLYARHNYLALERLEGYSPQEALLRQRSRAHRDKLLLLSGQQEEEESEEKTRKRRRPEGWDLHIRVINLDDALLLQKQFIEEFKPKVLHLKEWCVPLRMDCSFRDFWGFERELNKAFGTVDSNEHGPSITFYGSNDFHHLSLALIRRIREPFNLLLLDNHPDYLKYYPGLHCGCWFNHACSLPTVQQAFHIGGASGEFEDDFCMRTTPWNDLLSGKIKMFPATEKFAGSKWDKVDHAPVLEDIRVGCSKDRMKELLAPYAQVLRQYPLYITLDKDCMLRSHTLQNWNSGRFFRREVMAVLEAFIELSEGRVVAIDVTGDFSPVDMKRHPWRSYLHCSQHNDTENRIKVEDATVLNQDTNLYLVKALRAALGLPRNPSSKEESDEGEGKLKEKVKEDEEEKEEENMTRDEFVIKRVDVPNNKDKEVEH